MSPEPVSGNDETAAVPEHVRRAVVDAVHEVLRPYDFDRGSTRWAVTYDAANAALRALGLVPVAVFREYPLGSGADWLHEDKERENPLGIEDGTTLYVVGSARSEGGSDVGK